MKEFELKMIYARQIANYVRFNRYEVLLNLELYQSIANKM